MRHWVSDYSDGELILAIASPHLTDEMIAELEYERLKRRQQDLDDLMEVIPT
jgi:hypothetical protein